MAHVSVPKHGRRSARFGHVAMPDRNRQICNAATCTLLIQSAEPERAVMFRHCKTRLWSDHELRPTAALGKLVELRQVSMHQIGRRNEFAAFINVQKRSSTNSCQSLSHWFRLACVVNSQLGPRSTTTNSGGQFLHEVCHGDSTPFLDPEH